MTLPGGIAVLYVVEGFGGESGVTTGGILAVGFLVLMVALVLRGIRGHPRGGDGSDSHYQAPGPHDIIAGD